MVTVDKCSALVSAFAKHTREYIATIAVQDKHVCVSPRLRKHVQTDAAHCESRAYGSRVLDAKVK